MSTWSVEKFHVYFYIIGLMSNDNVLIIAKELVEIYTKTKSVEKSCRHFGRFYL